VQLISYKMATKCLLRMQMKKPYFTSGPKFDVRFEFSAPDFLFQTGILALFLVNEGHFLPMVSIFLYRI